MSRIPLQAVFSLEVGRSQGLKGQRRRRRQTIKPKTGSRTGVSGLFRCADTPGGRVLLCLHAPRHCGVGVPAVFYLLCEDTFLVSLGIPSRMFVLHWYQSIFQHVAVLLVCDDHCVARVDRNRNEFEAKY